MDQLLSKFEMEMKECIEFGNSVCVTFEGEGTNIVERFFPTDYDLRPGYVGIVCGNNRMNFDFKEIQYYEIDGWGFVSSLGNWQISFEG